jgi:hypothetical protein
VHPLVFTYRNYCSMVYSVIAKEVSMSNVTVFIPAHKKIKELAWEYVKGIKDFEAPTKDLRDQYRAYIAGYIFSAAKRKYRELCRDSRYQNKPIELVAEIAFWRGIHAVLARNARYAIAEKMKFVLPEIS